MWRKHFVVLQGVRAFFRGGRAAMLDTNWQKLYEAAILEINPDKLVTRIGAAEQAIAQREPLLDITELERHKLADARSMLKTLSRIRSEEHTSELQSPDHLVCRLLLDKK